MIDIEKLQAKLDAAKEKNKQSKKEKVEKAKEAKIKEQNRKAKERMKKLRKKEREEGIPRTVVRLDIKQGKIIVHSWLLERFRIVNRYDHNFSGSVKAIYDKKTRIMSLEISKEKADAEKGFLSLKSLSGKTSCYLLSTQYAFFNESFDLKYAKNGNSTVYTMRPECWNMNFSRFYKAHEVTFDGSKLYFFVKDMPEQEKANERKLEHNKKIDKHGTHEKNCHAVKGFACCCEALKSKSFGDNPIPVRNYGLRMR